MPDVPALMASDPAPASDREGSRQASPVQVRGERVEIGDGEWGWMLDTSGAMSRAVPRWGCRSRMDDTVLRAIVDHPAADVIKRRADGRGDFGTVEPW